MADTTNTVGIKVVADTSGVTAEMRKIDQAAARTAGELEKVGKSGGFKKAGEDAAGASSKIEASQRNLIGSIQRTTAAMESGGRSTSKYYELLAQQRGVDGSALAPYLAQLRAVELAQAKSNATLGGGAPAFDKLGMSAKQTAAALRGVPAQITDIVTSLQGGQAPLTVFLQQGGQLRDMFGSAGGAARALGGALLGMINPLTISAAAVVGLAVAYNQGANEAQAFSRSLILTGNAAGTTAGQLGDMARNISATVGTQGAAAEALAAMAGTGRVAANNLQYFSEVAVKAQSAIGISAADMAKDFADLGRAPLKASEQLTEKYRYLTAAVYEQIKAAEEQGRLEDAASIAQNAYARAMDDRAVKVKASLGTLETAWNSLGTAVKKGWDLMLNVGREDTLTEQLSAVQVQIEKARAKANKPFDASFGGNAEARAQLKTNLDLEASLQRQIKASNEKAQAEAASIKRQEALQSWSREGEKFLSKEVQLQREITKARTEGLAAGKTQAEIERRIAEIRDARRDKGGDSAIKKEATEYRGLVTSINERIEANKLEIAGQDVLSASRRMSIKLDESVASGKSALTAKRIEEVRALIATVAAQEAEIEVKKRIAKANEEAAKSLAAYALKTAQSVDAANKEASNNERLVATYGMSKSAIEQLDIARLEEQLTQLRGIDMADDEVAALERIIDAKKRSASAMGSVETQEANKKANELFLADYTKTVDKYGDVFRTGFADMLNNGKDGWKSFTKSLVTTFKTSVADQIYKMFAQKFVVNMVGNIAGITGGAGIAGTAQAASGASQASSLVSTASNAYSLVTGGMTLAGGLGTGFLGSVSGGLMGAGAGAGFTSAAGLAIGEGIAGVVGPSVAASISSGMGAVAAAMPWLAAAAIGGVLLKKAFGRGPKEVTGTSINGMFTSDGFTGTTDEAWKKEGGWLRSDKTGVDKTAIDAETAKQFTAGYDAIKVASADFAKVLGLNADSIATRSQSLSIALTKDEEANKKAVSEFFIGVGNSIASELLPTLADFSKEGEGASATLQRLAKNYATIDAALTSIGLSFGSVGADSLAARERLVTLSGGIDALAQNAAGFAQNFLSEAERIAPVAAAVSKSMTDLGFSLVDSREEFKSLVMGLDLTTEAGAKNYTALMKLQGAFAQVYPAVDLAAKAMEDAAKAAQAQADAVEAQARAIEAVKSAASGLLGGVDDSFSVLQRVAESEKARATKAHDVTMRRLQESIDLENAAIAKRRALSDAISSTLSQRDSGLDRSGAQAQIQAAIAIAKASGVLPSADSLKDALSVLSRDSSDMFATLQDQQRDAAQTQNGLAELGKLSDAALSVEERTLASLEKQKEAAQASYEAQIARLDEMVSSEQAQIDELKGISTNGLSLVQAIEGVRLAILAAQGNAVSGSTAAITNAYKSALGRAPDAAGLDYFKGQAAAGTSVSAIIDTIKNSPEAKAQDLYKSLLGRSGDAAGIAYWTNAIASGVSVDAAREAFMRSEEYKKLRGFAVGTNYLPKTMPILAHEGERIIPAADNRELMQALRDPQANSEVLAAAVDRLGVELVGLRSETRAVATHSEKTARLLNGVIRENAITTKAEEAV